MQFILSLHLNNEEIIVFSILGLNHSAIDKVITNLKYEKAHALLWYSWLRPLGTLPGLLLGVLLVSAFSLGPGLTAPTP